MSQKYTVGAVVPIFNEEIYLLESVKRLLAVEIITQIVLVDDNSSDKSYEIAKNIENKYKKVKAIKTIKNLGKGNAVKEGSNVLNTDYLIVHDADLEYFPEDITDMYFESIKFPNSLIIGSRRIGNKERKNIYLFTYLGNRLFAIFFSILHKTKISDIASCYWLISLDIFKSFNIQEKGFAIEVEVLSKFLQTKNTIKEVPIQYEARSYQDGKKIKLKDAVSIFLKILKYKMRF